MQALPSSLVSVVIPVHNGEAFVARALRSVLSQTDPKLEVVVVDDGSTDQTSTVLGTFHDARLRVVGQPNRGVSAARNRGLELAQGRWVAFLDADDEWLPDHIEIFREGPERLPSARLFGAGYRYQQEGRTWLPRIALPSGLQAWVELSDYFELASSGSPPVCSSAVFVERSAVIAAGGFPVGIRSGEDLLTWARLAVRSPVAIGRRVTAVLHLRAGTQGGGTLRRLPLDLEDVATELAKLVAAADGVHRRAISRYLRTFYLGAASQWVRVPRRWQTLTALGRAARLGGCSPKWFALLGMTALPTGLVRRIFACRRAS